METLGKLKHIIDFLSYVAYNLKLETSLLCDQFALIPQPQRVVIKSEKDEILPLHDLQRLEFALNEVANHYLTTILSCSPSIVFTAPYVLLKKLEDIKAKKKLIESKPIKVEDDNESDKNILVEPTQTFDLTKSPGEDEMIVSAIDSTRPISYVSSLEKERADVEYIAEKAKLSLDPFSHQHIVVLRSLVCTKCVEPCQPPELQIIEYYHESDVTLGQYLEDLYYKIHYACSNKGCEEQQISHVQNYIHEGGGVKISVQEMFCPNPGMEDIMLMWSACKLCFQSTPILPISENTWKYSFGKYLELSYYLPQMACRADICPHMITRDHIRHFSWKNVLISIEYIPIQIFEISVPPLDLEIKSDVFVKLREKDAESLRSEIISYFDSISERIQSFSYEILPLSKIQPAKELMNEMSKKCSIEKKLLLQLLQQKCVSTQPADIIALNYVKKGLSENVSEWDAEFSSFVRNYVQPDTRDLRKITSVQLKKIFDMGKPDPELEDLPTISENYLPLLGSSPKDDAPINSHFSPTQSPRKRRFSVDIMLSLRKLDNRIHLPRFGSSPTDRIKITQELYRSVEINLSKSISFLNISKLNLHDSQEITHGMMLFRLIKRTVCLEK
jgi:1-phosphatidylinositol-3-phosphate 5-kinase